MDYHSKTQSTKYQRHGGFTLIELVIVLAIVVLLATVALPGYQKQVVQTYRNTAQGDLMAFSQAMEREYATNFTYVNAAAGTSFPDSSPLDGANKRYTLSIQEKTAATFKLRATPIANSTQAGDGMLELDHLGRRSWDSNNDGDFTDAGEKSWSP